MLRNRKKIIDIKLYTTKKNKSPDYLFKILEKYRGKAIFCQNQSQELLLEQQIKQNVKKQLIDKRVKKIIQSKHQRTVSSPIHFRKKKWISPLQQQKKQFIPSLTDHNSNLKNYNKEDMYEKVNKYIKVVDINHKLRNFGQYLQTQFDGAQKQYIKQVFANKQSKMSYLRKKFHNLQKLKNKSMLITNNSKSSQFFSYKTLNNPLMNDQFFKKIMRKNDSQLMKILVETLSISGTFTLTSYINFYDIFIWQQAIKKDIVYFVTKLLMGDRKQASINQISQRIKYICTKIDLNQVAQALDGFQEVVKRLIFAQQYSNTQDSKYYLTRKALEESLQRNQQCISIFLNIFYAD